MSEADEKRKLYKQILSWGDPHAVFARMRELGFWPPREPMPGDPPEQVKERKEIEGELLELRAKHSAISNPQKALEEERKRRWDESKTRPGLDSEEVTGSIRESMLVSKAMDRLVSIARGELTENGDTDADESNGDESPE